MQEKISDFMSQTHPPTLFFVLFWQIVIFFMPQPTQIYTNFQLLFLGTGKLQLADVRLNRVIKHRHKQSQMQYLLENRTEQWETSQKSVLKELESNYKTTWNINNDQIM